jgi:hypothetical protein
VQKEPTMEVGRDRSLDGRKPSRQAKETEIDQAEEFRRAAEQYRLDRGEAAFRRSKEWLAQSKDRAQSSRASKAQARAREIRDATQREVQKGQRGRGRGDPAIYSPDIERRIEEGIREREKKDKPPQC